VSHGEWQHLTGPPQTVKARRRQHEEVIRAMMAAGHEATEVPKELDLHCAFA
jgi:hypothetical protein